MRLTFIQLKYIISEIVDPKGLRAMATIKSFLYDRSVSYSGAERALRLIAFLPGTDKESLRVIQYAVSDARHGDFVVDAQVKAAFRRL